MIMRGRKLKVEREKDVGADGFKSGIGGDIICASNKNAEIHEV
jgi:hypothetical protein